MSWPQSLAMSAESLCASGAQPAALARTTTTTTFQGSQVLLLLPHSCGIVCGIVCGRSLADRGRLNDAAICGIVFGVGLQEHRRSHSAPGRCSHGVRSARFGDRLVEVRRRPQDVEIARSAARIAQWDAPDEARLFKPRDLTLHGVGRLLAFIADGLLRWPRAPILIGIVGDRPKRGLWRSARRHVARSPIDGLMTHSVPSPDV
jgi:hypothetical protein